MPEQFKFNRSHRTVLAALTTNEIKKVIVWQGQASDFSFEFHTQHEAGWPCYLREPDGPKRNLPKLNLKQWTGGLLQGESVKDKKKGIEFKNVITNNLAAFQKMAKRFYEGVEEVNTVRLVWFAKFTCTLIKQPKPVFIRLPDRGQGLGSIFWSNMQNRAEKPRCQVHKNSTCLDGGVAVQLQSQEAIKHKLKYDDSGKISGS